MNQKFSFALTITLLFVYLTSAAQSVPNRGNSSNVNLATDYRKTDCEQNIIRLYEMLDAKDQEIKRSRDQANELIKVLVDLKRNQNTQTDISQNAWTTQPGQVVDHIASERKSNYHVRRNYIRGPRGGCYYINSNGNKTYVDRSLCN